MKALVHMSENDEAMGGDARRLFDTLREPITYVVRVYVLIVKDLPESGSDKPDPYLKLSIGGQTRENRKDASSDESEVGFYQVGFQLR